MKLLPSRCFATGVPGQKAFYLDRHLSQSENRRMNDGDVCHDWRPIVNTTGCFP